MDRLLDIALSGFIVVLGLIGAVTAFRWILSL